MRAKGSEEQHTNESDEKDGKKTEKFIFEKPEKKFLNRKRGE